MATVVDFSESETFQILWALSDAIDLATQVDALSTVPCSTGCFAWFGAGWKNDGRTSVTEVETAERVSVGEAARQTGIAGDRIFRAIFDGEISTSLNERGIDRVLVDEVLTLRDRAS